MRASRSLTRILTIATVLMVSLSTVQPAYAAPVNDNFADALEITDVPFDIYQDLTDATAEPGEPANYCTWANPLNSAWLKYTPATGGTLRAAFESDDTDPLLVVYIGASVDTLTQVACAQWMEGATFNVQAGIAYYFQLSSVSGSPGTGHFVLNLIPPPANDNLADATIIASLSFDTEQDVTAATNEPNEPYPSCASANPFYSTWLSYTPATGGSLMAWADYVETPPLLAVYEAATQPAMETLTEIGCNPYSGRVTFAAEPGVTYYFQLGSTWGGPGTVHFYLDVTPPPEVGIDYGPYDPSIFDNVNFSAWIYDPAGQGLAACEWSTGDGGSSSDCIFSHRYAADGDYTVNLTATTNDGRTDSAESLVQVRTHDVAITKLSVPQTASVNQTRTINVTVKNKRYSEYVEVMLVKGLPTGDQVIIGTLTLFVPARAVRPATFKFSYTFTAADAQIGKVTFKAIATIADRRDAFLPDNTAMGTTLVIR